MKKKTLDCLQKDLSLIMEAANKGNDLTVSLLITSYIDACLGTLLRVKLKKSQVTENLLKPSGALGNISSKSEICYSLDFIDKSEYQNIQKLLEIRNKFAHLYDNNAFDEGEVDNLCKCLPSREKLISSIESLTDNHIILENAKSNRTVFTYTAMVICMSLLKKIRKA